MVPTPLLRRRGDQHGQHPPHPEMPVANHQLRRRAYTSSSARERQEADRRRLGDGSRREEAADLTTGSDGCVDVQIRGARPKARGQGHLRARSCPSIGRDEDRVVRRQQQHVERVIVRAAGHTKREPDERGDLGSDTRRPRPRHRGRALHPFSVLKASGTIQTRVSYRGHLYLEFAPMLSAGSRLIAPRICTRRCRSR
jgi:hypothetical protein